MFPVRQLLNNREYNEYTSKISFFFKAEIRKNEYEFLEKDILKIRIHNIQTNI